MKGLPEWMPSGTTEIKPKNENDSYSEFLKIQTKSLSIVNACIMTHYKQKYHFWKLDALTSECDVLTNKWSAWKQNTKYIQEWIPNNRTA
jgi:hypothetical protein